MREWNVTGFAGFDAKRDADQCSFHVIDAGCLGIDRETARRGQFFQPVMVRIDGLNGDGIVAAANVSQATTANQIHPANQGT